MISISTILTIVVLHFIADWLLQSRNTAERKSEDVSVLLLHCFVYGLPFMIFVSPIYGAINLWLHFVVDYVTSRINKHYYTTKQMKKFWNMIGFDQTIHFVILFTTYYLIFDV